MHVMILNLKCLKYLQIQARTPVLMCSVPGYDASGRVDDLAAEMSRQLSSIAIGMCSLLEKYHYYRFVFLFRKIVLNIHSI